MKITIKDIAKKANVSITTVSRVINNKPDVSEKTKKRVQKVIGNLSYRPNEIARGLVLQRSYTIGLIIPDISNPFFPEVARGVENKAKKMGYSVIFYNTDNNKKEEKKAIELFKSKQVDGIILSLSIGTKKELNELAESNFPTVQIDRKVPSINLPIVTIDNVLSAYKATGYLVELGHKDIGHISGDLGTKTAQDRLNGFYQALRDNKLSIRKKWVVEGDYSKESGYNAMKGLLKGKRPTALFIANDLMAIGAYEAITEAGFKIPDDISIIGHDDIDMASIIKPGLTTMVQPKYKLGELAAEMLIKRINKVKLNNDCNIILDTELNIRESTGRF